MVIDWVMRKTTEDAPRGIRWNTTSPLEDLDFAEDLALLSHTHHHLQEKTVITLPARLDLNSAKLKQK